jgi:hypothetical protein
MAARTAPAEFLGSLINVDADGGRSSWLNVRSTITHGRFSLAWQQRG